jgi:diaminopimelate epimerase
MSIQLSNMTKNKKKIVIDFLKVEGAGNDFVLIDNYDSKYNLSLPQLARTVCDRHRGIGADGILLLEKSKHADIKMRYLNADGSEGAMCGNGGRCIANYALAKYKKNIITIEALDYIYHAKYSGKDIRLFMKDSSETEHNLIFHYKNKIIKATFINTGSPHLVVFTKNLPKTIGTKLKFIDVMAVGRYLRNEKLFFPAGTNVNFVEVSKEKIIKIRTYERGVEDETLACGTGSIAAAIIASQKYSWKPPIKVFTKSGSRLIINFKIEGSRAKNVSIKGEAKNVFFGTFSYSNK